MAISQTHAAYSSAQAPQQGEETNPFLPIAFKWRVLIITYVLASSVVTPALQQIIYIDSTPLSEWRTLASISYQLLLIAPLLFYRRRFGWLHPILFPTLFSLAKSLLEGPEQLLAFTNLLHEPSQQSLTHPGLGGMEEPQVAWAMLQEQLLSVSALICYYAGFFFEQRYQLFSSRIPAVKFTRPNRVAPVALGVVSITVVATLVHIQQHGGLTAYMLQTFMGGGRLPTAEETRGTVVFAARMGGIACLLWYALKERAVHTILFWGSLGASLLANFFISGSRSSVFFTLAFLVLIWALHHGKVPKGRVLVLGVLVYLLLGTMGSLRRSAMEGKVDWRIFAETGVAEAVEKTSKEVDERQEEQGGAPIMARVPEEIGFLYGSTYASAALALLPRAVWSGKPKGVGALNGQVIHGRGERGAAIPAGPVAEAYWNFWIPGVVVVFLTYGIFHKWLARAFRRYANVPAVWAPYIFTLVWMTPNSSQLNTAIKSITLCVVVLFFMGSIRLKK